MKTLLRWVTIPVWVLLTLLLCSKCSLLEDRNVDPDEKELEISEEDTIKNEGSMDTLLETLVFTSGTKITESLPEVANTSVARTNTKDTIYTLPGVKVPIRISHPASIRVKGMYVATQQGTFYYDVPVDQEEKSDTVSVIMLGILPEAAQIPYAVPVKIVPYDQNKSPVDVIERVISVEPPSNNGCDILIPRPSTLTDTSGTWAPEWFWFATMVLNPEEQLTFLNAPGYLSITNTTYQGCCDPNRPGGKCHPLSTTLNASVNVSIRYSIESETFAFFTDGTFVRQTHERKQNFDPLTTDWCAGSAGYRQTDPVVTYFGKHDYTPGNSSITYGTTYANCDLCGYGSRGGQLTHSCHMMVITRNVGFSKEVRLYVRNPVSGWYE